MKELFDKENLRNYFRVIVERLGFFVNPVLLKITKENNQLLVFYFHGLYQSAAQKDLNHIDPQQNMTVSQFNDFIDYFLKNKYEFVKPDDLINGEKSDSRYIMLTFDDGYFNNLLALDVLNKFKVPAIFFITAANVIENKAFWWDVIYKFRMKQGFSWAKIHKEQEYLKQFKFNYIDNYISQQFGRDAFKPWSDIDRPLTITELKTLSENSNSTIGNHTFNHIILPNYEEEVILKEFSSSNDFLAGITGKVPEFVAFPNGDFNGVAIDAAKKIGFKVAFNAEPRKTRIPLNSNNLITLGRFMANIKDIDKYGSFFRLGYTPGSLYASLNGFLNPLNKHKKHYYPEI
jgi:peptidoglycan/xylan/chitin deacetylase (PgdA/CDA1 family)